MEEYILDPGGVIKHNLSRSQVDAIRIIYHTAVAMDQSTIEFVNNLKSGDRKQDKQDLFFYLFKYAYNSRLRKEKMEDLSITLTKAIFEKLIRNNTNCIYSATAAFNDAMENYTKFMKVTDKQSATPSWFSRTFGSKSTYDTMVKSVPPNAYLIMVAVTFAILQYELMFNQRCVELLKLYRTSYETSDETSKIHLNHPKTWDTFDQDFLTTIDNIITWLEASHNSTDEPYTKIMSFMRTIGVVQVLDKQFENTYGGNDKDFSDTKGNPRPGANFFKWDQLNRLILPSHAGGRRRTKTIARKKRHAKKHSYRRRR